MTQLLTRKCVSGSTENGRRNDDLLYKYTTDDMSYETEMDIILLYVLVRLCYTRVILLGICIMYKQRYYLNKYFWHYPCVIHFIIKKYIYGGRVGYKCFNCHIVGN